MHMHMHMGINTLLAEAPISTTDTDFWKPVAFIASLMYASMKIRPDYHPILIWAMRIAMVLVTVFSITEYVSYHYNVLPLLVLPARAWDYIFPLGYVLLIVYDSASAHRAARARARLLAEDRAWSEPSPLGRLVMTSFESCTIDAQSGQGSLRLSVSNTSGAERVLWVSVQFEFYYIDKATGQQVQIALERTVVHPVALISPELHKHLSITLPSIGEETTKKLFTLSGSNQITIHTDIAIATIVNITTNPQVAWLRLANQGGPVTVFGKPD